MLWQKLTKSIIVGGALLLGLPGALQAQYAINLVAGGGPNGPALSSSIGLPGGIARDGSGNTYIADADSNRIYKVDSTGTISVFAGNGSGVGSEGGYSGDGGPAINAELGRPEGIAVDASGNVYIADTDNSVIREVTASGTITTVAGVYYSANQACNFSGDNGPATSAQLCRPSGVFVDGSGNIFIADTDNSVIREVVAGTVQTVAGNITLGAGYSGDGAAATSAKLALPNGVFVDGSGNIFIADTYNSVIREVSSGIITTVAGTYYSFQSVCKSSGNGGPATSAQLCLPTAVSLDSSGNIYIADTENHAVRVVTGGNIQAFAGTGTSGYAGDGGTATSAELSSPNGLFADASGDIFIADTQNFVVRQVTGGTIQPFAGNHHVAYSGDGGTATNASLNASGSVSIDGAGNIFVADTDNNVIREITAATGDIQTVAGTGTLGYSGDGAAATSAELSSPFGVFVDTLGDLFIADTNNSRVRCVVGTAGGCLGSVLPVGSITTVAGTGTMGSTGDGGAATSAELQNPYGVYVDGAGDLFIADTVNLKIRCVVGAAGGCFGSPLAVGSITTVAGNGQQCQPASVTPPAVPGPSCGDTGPAISAQLNFPTGVSADASGDLFIADTFNSEIREVVAATGNIQTVAGTNVNGYSGDGGLATSAQLNQPYGVYVDGLGNIFIADTDNSVVREVVATTGNIQTVAGNGIEGYSGDGGAGSSAQLARPLGVAGNASGNTYIADTENSRIRGLSSTVTVASIPVSATLPTGGTQQFAATVGGANDTSVTWQVNGVTGGNATLGTISNLGSYQAPAAVPSPATVSVAAIANATGLNSSSALVNIVSATGNVTLTLTTSPTIADVYTNATQTFIANVSGTTNTAVNWQVNGVLDGNATVGTISSAGVYSAPATVPTPATVLIGAVLQADSTVSASYPAVIVATPTASQSAAQTVSAGGSATFAMSLEAKTGDSRHAIALSCLKSSLPLNATCTFTPPTIVPGLSAVPFTLTVNLPNCSGAVHRPKDMFLSRIFVALLPVAGILFVGLDKRKKRWLWMLLLVLLCTPLGLLISCGGGGSSGSSNPACSSLAGVYHIVVQGTTAAQPAPVTITTVTLTVQ